MPENVTSQCLKSGCNNEIGDEDGTLCKSCIRGIVQEFIQTHPDKPWLWFGIPDTSMSWDWEEMRNLEEEV
jgi:hypothetical protein